jgi:cation diffusion facilitator CzcD-associated flavoprotein CzcO
MATTELQADYLVIGAGAMGMAFVDTLIAETEASVIMVERRDRPGGHWNTAYPFVRLHQPSSFYGVNSEPLGTDRIDDHGWNQGLYELATGTEVVSYFDQLMTRTFIPSGRVQFFSNSNYIGDSTFVSAVSGETFTVTGDHKVVDATYMNVTVPSMRPPAYDVGEGVVCVPINDLPLVAAADRDYVVVGAGKTAMDAVLWLLANQCDPARIHWVMPRDSWILNRAFIQPGDAFVNNGIRFAIEPLKAAVDAADIDDFFERLEAAELMMRIDASVRPTMYRCATITTAELDQLRRVTQIVRLGRVTAIETDRIVMTEGSVPTTPTTIHVDCTADGLARRPEVPVFEGDRITLQAVRTCQQVFSAAFLAHLEAAYGSDAEKNALATPIPHPNTDLDYLRTQMQSGLNSFTWRQDPTLTQWLIDARLDAFSSIRGGDDQSPAMHEAMLEMAELGPLALQSMQRLIASSSDQP